jgi:uncharacterized repeat protein (TIGR03803 family)
MKSFFRMVATLVLPLIIGVAVRSAQGQTYTVLYTFHGSAYAAGPLWGVTQDPADNLYGTTSGEGNGNGTIYRLNPATGNFVDYNLKTGNDYGEFPASLILDSNGNLFGNTYYGGPVFGTIYEISQGEETVLHAFEGEADGAYPQSPLIQDDGRNLYGTAYSYGGPSAAGTIFKLTESGNFTVLYSFTGGTEGSTDGCRPSAGLVADGKGNFYGTTAGCGAFSNGTVFEFSNTGQEIVLYSFKGGNDGTWPKAPLIIDAHGNLYGTTSGGNVGCGTVFVVSKTGEEKVLHHFGDIAGDGCNSTAGLVRDSEGNLYGTTQFGGKYDAGTIFKLSPVGDETILYNFTGGSDGGNPPAAMIQDTEGNLYGTTQFGGEAFCGSASDQYGCGVVFKLTP